MLPQKQTRSKKIASFVICFLMILISLSIIFYRREIVDQIVVWQFTPSVGVEELISRTDFSDKGRFLLYASQTELEDAADFNNSCSKIENTTSILGCYSDSRIYVYNVTNQKLDGIREVTAAHEMLHAAYDRLSQIKKDQLATLLEAEYTKLSSNEELSDLMQFYARTEPGERRNELHSIIGTVVTDIDPELESYYDEYFADRQKIVSYNTKYTGVFKELSDRANVLSSKLNTLSETIPEDSDRYNSMVQLLNSDIESFNVRAASGDFTSWTQFYNERSVLETRVEELSVLRQIIDSDVSDYNVTLDEYNSIALESQDLYNSINSTLVEAKSL